MELSHLSSILVLFAAINIFYAMYSFAMSEWVSLIVSLATYLVLVYAVAGIDGKIDEDRPMPYIVD